MFTKFCLLFLVIITMIFINCQTFPQQSISDTQKKVSSIFPQGIKDFVMETSEVDFVGIGFSTNENQRKIFAIEEISRRLCYKYRYTGVNFYSENIKQRYNFYITLGGYLSSSALSLWLMDNGISPKAEYSEGEWYGVAYNIPESILSRYPQPIMPVITLFTIEEAVKIAAGNISDRLPRGSKIAIVNLSAVSPDDSVFVIEELSTELVRISKDEKKEFIMVDRRSLDVIQKEQNFHLSGDVSDDNIVSIGKFLGANVVITGSIDGYVDTKSDISNISVEERINSEFVSKDVNNYYYYPDYRRLRVKALDVESARLLIQTNLKY